MIARSFSAGLSLLRKRPWLAVLIYLLQLALALVVTAGLAVGIGAVLSNTGFDDVLAQGFDVSLWADIFEDQPDLAGNLIIQLVWALPLLFAWQVAVGVGLAHALRDGGVRSFWAGVGRYFVKGVLLSGLFAAVAVGWLIFSGIVAVVGNLLWSGSVGTFWVNFVIVPIVLISGIAVVDLMQDYARFSLVISERPVVQSWFDGMRFPLRNGGASWLYLMWFVPALVLWVMPTTIGALAGAGILIFLIQQILMLARAGVTVAWIGSEVDFFERIADRDRPLIADAEPATKAETDLPPALPDSKPDVDAPEAGLA